MKEKPASKIPTTQTNTNRKRKITDADPLTTGSSLLKKNEFTLIIAGALVVCVVVFFLFFRTTGPKTAGFQSPSQDMPAAELAGRLEALEMSLAGLQRETGAFSDDSGNENNAQLVKIQQQVSRLEAAVSLKLDSLNERMGKLEQRVADIRKSVSSAPPRKTTSKKQTTAKKTTVKKTTEKKTTEPEKKAPIFHTVKKGETLWRIAQKYETTVAALRKLNKLSPDADIYPGTNLLVR